MSITPTKVHNPCGVCDDISGKCRQGTDDLNYFQCMTFADTKKLEVINGFKCIVEAGDSDWAQFKPATNESNGIGFSPRVIRKAKAKDYSSALGINELDKGIRALASHSGLSDKHLVNLKTRGLPDPAISRGLFFSVTPNAKVPPGIPNSMPGVKFGKVRAASEGYACVSFDPMGRATGWQIRIDGATENKYRWAVGCHLKNGELPISSAYPTELKRSAIGMCEGFLKASVAAEKHGQIMLGASSANFPIEQLQEHLDAASAHLGDTKRVEFFVDAGCLSNRHVMKRYTSEFEKIRKCGYEPVVVWWGQLEKSAGDIDEIADLSQVKYLSTDEFLASAKNDKVEPEIIHLDKSPHEGLKFKCYANEDYPEKEERIRVTQRKLRSLSYPADIEISSRYLPDDLINQLPKSGLIGIKAPKGCGKSVLLNKIIAIAKEQGVPMLSITPRIALGREQAVKWEITWIDEYGQSRNSGINTASQIEKISLKIEKLREDLLKLDSFQGSLLVDSIAENEKKTTEIISEIEKHEAEINNINVSALNAMALCWDSLWKVKDRDYTNGLVIIDEAELGLNHLITGSTCRGSRPKIIRTFKGIVNDCLMMGGRVILSDADLSDLSINYIRDLLPIPINPFIIKNEYIGKENTWSIDFRTGSRDCTLEQIIQLLKDGLHLFITTDSKKEARALEKLIIEKCQDFERLFDDDNAALEVDESKALIIRLDSGTSEHEIGKEIIRKPNESIMKWQPRVVIATPTLGVGVSIDESTVRVVGGASIPYFDAVAGLFFGVIEPSQCRQQLARVRANVPRLVSAIEGNHRIGGNASFFPNEVSRQSMKYRQESLSMIDVAQAIAGDDASDAEIIEAMGKLHRDCWDEQGQTWNEPSIKLHSAFKARENYGLWNLSNLLREELEDEGHHIFSIKGTKGGIGDLMSGIKEVDRIAEAQARAAAPVIDIEIARELAKKVGSTSEEKRSVAKAFLQEELPELELDAEFIDKAALKDNGRWLSEQKLRWMAFNLDAVIDRDTSSWLKALRGGIEHGIFAADIQVKAPKIKAIQSAGLFEWIDLENADKTYLGNSDEGKQFLSRCIENRELIKVALGVSVCANSSPMKLAKNLLGKMGIKLQKTSKSKKDGRHEINQESLTDPDALRVQASLGRKWTNCQNDRRARAEVGGDQLISIYKNADVPPISEEESQLNSIGESASSEYISAYTVEELSEAFQYADSFEMFQAIVEHEPVNVIKDAIALLPTIPLRQMLRGFYESLYGQLESLWGNVADRVANTAQAAF
jgi:hypothetical protein